MNKVRKGLKIILLMGALFLVSHILAYFILSQGLNLFIRSLLAVVAVYLILEILKSS